MRIARFRYLSEIYMGRIAEDVIVDVEGFQEIPNNLSIADVQLLNPCCPSKIVAVGLNYRDHASELNQELPKEPLLFLKPASSIIGPGESIILPPQSSRVDYEAELGIVIADPAHNISKDDARDYILGYICLNDVTARDLQSKDGQWTRAKGFDTFCPIGPWIEADLDPSDLKIELRLNNEVKQSSRTSNLIFDCFELVAYISHVMTLLPGDIIATGTAAGIGPMKAGDSVEVTIEGIGSLVNKVAGA